MEPLFSKRNAVIAATAALFATAAVTYYFLHDDLNTDPNRGMQKSVENTFREIRKKGHLLDKIILPLRIDGASDITLGSTETNNEGNIVVHYGRDRTDEIAFDELNQSLKDYGPFRFNVTIAAYESETSSEPVAYVTFDKKSTNSALIVVEHKEAKNWLQKTRLGEKIASTYAYARLSLEAMSNPISSGKQVTADKVLGRLPAKLAGERVNLSVPDIHYIIDCGDTLTLSDNPTTFDYTNDTITGTVTTSQIEDIFSANRKSGLPTQLTFISSNGDTDRPNNSFSYRLDQDGNVVLTHKMGTGEWLKNKASFFSR